MCSCMRLPGPSDSAEVSGIIQKRQSAALYLQEAVKNCQYWRLRDQNGKPPGVIGYYPKRAVTFIDNHDTGALSYIILMQLVTALACQCERASF
jgi:hypothetical protein